MRFSSSFSVLLFVLAACGGDRDTGLNQRDGDNDSCPEGQLEDGLGVCRDTCQASGGCADGFECNLDAGLCLPLPECDPEQCDEGYICPEEGAECIPDPEQQIECTGDGDCPFGYKCEDNTCVSRAGDIIATCANEGDTCPFGMTCQFGICIGCLDDLQCGPGGQCVLGTCVVADLGPAGECLGLECSDGTRCNPMTGVCEPTCSTDDDCNGGVCAPVLEQCTVDFQCDAPEDCLTNNCVASICVGCTTNDDCQAGTQCVSVGQVDFVGGACLPNFEGGGGACSGVECAEGELCDSYDGSCYPANGTCGGDSDCRAGQDCNFLGLCEGCAVDGDCRFNQRCLFGTCVLLEQ